MSIPPPDEQTLPPPDKASTQKPLRLWPGVALVVLQWLLWFVVPFVMPSAVIFGVIGGVLCGLAVVLWWLLFSRAPWAERLGAIALMILAVFVTYRIVHISIQNGMMGMMLPIFSILI